MVPTAPTVLIACRAAAAEVPPLWSMSLHAPPEEQSIEVESDRSIEATRRRSPDADNGEEEEEAREGSLWEEAPVDGPGI